MQLSVENLAAVPWTQKRGDDCTSELSVANLHFIFQGVTPDSPQTSPLRLKRSFITVLKAEVQNPAT
jgi:hypothetical protein